MLGLMSPGGVSGGWGGAPWSIGSDELSGGAWGGRGWSKDTATLFAVGDLFRSKLKHGAGGAWGTGEGGGVRKGVAGKGLPHSVKRLITGKKG